MSCPERLSVSGPPEYADVAPFARTLVDRFPDRVMWGTDWPHPNMKKVAPDDGVLVDYIAKSRPRRRRSRRSWSITRCGCIGVDAPGRHGRT